jgi:hypothetical protein
MGRKGHLIMPTIKQLEDQGRALRGPEGWSRRVPPLVREARRVRPRDKPTSSPSSSSATRRRPSTATRSTVVPQPRSPTHGDPLVRSPGHRLRRLQGDGGRQGQGRQVDVKVAATIDEGIIPAYSGGAGLAGQLNAPQFLPGIVGLKFQPLTVADLIPSGTTNSSSVSYVIESAFQDLTATVSEKGTKPQLDLTLARRQDNVTKIANVAKVTDEMFQDAAGVPVLPDEPDGLRRQARRGGAAPERQRHPAEPPGHPEPLGVWRPRSSPRPA